MKKTILAIDSTTNHIFCRSFNDRDLDYKKIWDFFNPDNDKETFSANYFLQMRDNFDEVKYFKFINRIRSFGWKVDMGINGVPIKGKYAGVIEYGSCYAYLMQQLTLIDSQIKYEGLNKDDVDIEIILMANHLSYSKLLKEIKTQFPYVYRTLVCDTAGAHDQLMLWAEEVINVRDLDIVMMHTGLPIEDNQTEEAI